MTALHRSGKFTAFDAVDKYRYNAWRSTLYELTSIEKFEDKIIGTFNLNSMMGLDSFFVLTNAINNEQRLYRVHGETMAITGIDIRMVKSELVFPVFTK